MRAYTFLYSTDNISYSTEGLVHQVIPFMDVLTQHLDTFGDNLDLHPSVRTATVCGHIILNKYYLLTDESNFYRITLSELLVVVFV